MNLPPAHRPYLFLKEKPKVLLVHPNFPYVGTDKFPLGLGYVASYVRKHTPHVEVFDEQQYQLGWKYLEKMRPDIVGITATSPSFGRVRRFLISIGRLPPSTRPLVMMGGSHATFCPEEVLNAGVDLVLRGEVDLSLPQLFETPVDDWRSINGLSYRHEGEIVHTADASLLHPIDSAPFPARELFDPQFYPVMSLTTSRGCPYACKYCAATEFWGRKVRHHSVGYVERELESIAGLGYERVCFEDATFSTNKKRAINISQLFTENSSLKGLVWSCETRPDKLDSSLLEAFEEARCALIMLGVESASEEVLKKNNRTVEVDVLRETMATLVRSNVPLQLLMVFGLPGETAESVRTTIDFLEEFRPDRILLSLATAYPGTDLWDQPRRVTMPLEWIKRFTGHGVNSPLFLPEGMDPQQYRRLADELLAICRQINGENQKRFKEKQRLVQRRAVKDC